MNTTTVIARTYVRNNGESCLELVALGAGRYIVTRDGQVPDARRKIRADEAREFWDAAGYQIGERP